ncbi:leucine-rich repeat domain-containing protein [Christensenellaceae bacterium OttesenSCG-928-K19]|nr:leucine-rich repeat domain-containing protein [Christensenellaceae bacterium OttesenSCG-928-K19]
MKKLAIAVLLILACLCCACAVQTSMEGRASKAELGEERPVEIEAAGFRYIEEDDGIRIMDYIGRIAEVDIPEEVDGLPVKVMGNDAFYEDAEGNIHMLENTWEDAHVTIPAELGGLSVRVIDEDAFYQKTNMVSVELPESLWKIESGAFYRCDALETVKIPKNVEEIGESPFYRCSSLTEIIVDVDNPYYAAVDGVLYDKNIELLLEYPEAKKDSSYAIPDTVKEIAGDAFGYHCYYLRDVHIPVSVEKFPDYDIFHAAASDGITVYVEAGSAAEAYAKKFEIDYISK